MVDNKILDNICEDLRGQYVHDLNYFCEEYGINIDLLTTEDYHYIDNIVFLCAGCGWWCETSEMADGDNDEWRCTDCGEEDED